MAKPPVTACPVVAVLGALDPALEEWLRRNYATVIYRTDQEWQDCKDRHSIAGVVIRSPFRLNKADIATLPALKIVVRAGTGTDHIDVETLAQHGVRFATCPGNAHAVAELVLGSLIALKRDILRHTLSLARGDWTKFGPLGSEIAGARLGIVGFGHIGRRVAELANAFGARCVAIERPNRIEEKIAEATKRNVTIVTTLDQVLPSLDILVLACPLNANTNRLLNERRITLLPQSAIVVNVARGAVWDFTAILDALHADQLLGVVCDVYEQEPPSAVYRLDHPRLIATPHIGAQTGAAQKRIAARVQELISEHIHA